MTEIDKFYKSFNNEIATLQLSEENGATQEQAFTRCCLDLLTQANETENPVLAYDERGLGTKLQHKINGYSVSENYETLDLFISEFEYSESIEFIEKTKIDRACTRICNFFSKAFMYDYVSEVAETASIFEFSNLLSHSTELRRRLIRINAFILTNKKYKGDISLYKEFEKYKMYFNVIDIDKLYSLSASSRLPIELDLRERQIEIPCLKIPTRAEEYDAYMTYMPGSFLADLYDQYGFKLLEQNIRSFLQFKAKINRGIKDTIVKRPHMFFAFNNGISATAESINLDDTGRFITKIGNLQIVNGGQTTATLYHASKDAQESIKDVLVPVKISVIKDQNNLYEIIKSISKYANTQNKINDADLSANDPILVEIEKLSHYMLTPVTLQSSNQHYWFFDRISRQYDNLASLNSKSKSSKKRFELKYPKACKFTKYELAKYYNSYFELIEEGKIIVGPHCVVDGNEINFRAFRDHVMSVLKIDAIFYEDLIAKAILFKTVDKLHGTKRSKTPPIGDMKQVMVPYSIALLKIATNGCLDLHKIWINQCISDELSNFMYNLMVKLNLFLKENSPRSNIIEWATKEECWMYVKENFILPNTDCIASDIVDKRVIECRHVDEEDSDLELFEQQKNLIKSIDSKTWNEIAEWGKDSNCLNLSDQNFANNIAHKIKFDYVLNKREITKGISIYEIVCRNNYELLSVEDSLITEILDPDYVTDMLAWDKTLIVLDGWQIKIIQQSIKLKSYSRIRKEELKLIRKLLEKRGFGK